MVTGINAPTKPASIREKWNY